MRTHAMAMDVLLAGVLLGALNARPADAQPAVGAGPAAASGVPTSSLQGAWSWTSPGQGGADRNTLLFQPDGSYVRASHLASGQMLRSWGGYTAVAVSPNRVRLQSRTQGWLPTTLCTQAPGFPARCSPTPHPPEMSFVVEFTSPSTVKAEGTTLSRDPAPDLLRQNVPQQAMLAAPAPVQPSIRQPVMPAMHPYVTPNGPGNRIAAANHAGARTFVNENMRGCYTGPDGRLWGCQQ